MRQQCLGPLRSPRVWGASAQRQPPPWRPGYPDPHSLPGVTPLTRSFRVEAPDDTHATSKETPKSPRPRGPHHRLLSPHTPPRSALASPALLLSRRRAMYGLASSPLPLPCPGPGALCPQSILSCRRALASPLGLPPGSTCPSQPHLLEGPVRHRLTDTGLRVDAVHGCALGPRELVEKKAHGRQDHKVGHSNLAGTLGPGAHKS